MTAVVDAHQHFWTLERGKYHWLTAEHGPLYRTFEASELAPQLQQAGVDMTVLVQSDDSFEDTKAMLARSDANEWIGAVVGWVPLDRRGEAEDALDRWEGRGDFVGIRHLIHNEADPDWVVRDAVIDGLRLLAARGLTFDVVAVLPRHLEHVPTLAREVPELRIVIDHLAKPPIVENGWQPWADLLARAAEHENVYAKVSGLNTAADLENWTAKDLTPYIDHALACFGANRLMFGSDWPVAILAGDYEKVWNETHTAVADLSQDEQGALFGGTAVEFYGINSGDERA